jgi:hypothetical protein
MQAIVWMNLKIIRLYKRNLVKKNIEIFHSYNIVDIGK